MKCSPFSRRFMMRKRTSHFLKRHFRGDHHSMFHGTEQDHHHQKHKMEHGHIRHHGMHHGHHRMGHHHMHSENHHGRHSKMFHFNRRHPELMRVDSDDTNELPEINKDAPSVYAPKSKSQITKENNKFQICLDTSHYQPSEVSVKIVGKKIDVSAVHESTGEDWFEFHEMYRSFDIPDDVNADVITSRLDSDGKLTIEAALIIEENGISNVREIPVIRVNE